jgi:hypothetical protein
VQIASALVSTRRPATERTGAITGAILKVDGGVVARRN